MSKGTVSIGFTVPSNHPPPKQPPDTKDYTIKAYVGSGTHGLVWHAVRLTGQPGQNVVLKCLHQQYIDDATSKDNVKRELATRFWEAFKSEIDILQQCVGHPNIAQIVGCPEDYSLVVMTREDMDLKMFIKNPSTPHTLERHRCILKDTLIGVGYLHSIGVIHTDLKPENILISWTGGTPQSKICDFGCACKAAPGCAFITTGEISALCYRAPELLLGAVMFTHKIDEWAIGCIIMEMLAAGEIFFSCRLGHEFRSPLASSDPAHSNFHSDQLQQVLKKVGTPDPRSLEAIQAKCADLIKGWPTYPRNLEPFVMNYCRTLPDAAGETPTLWAQVVDGLLKSTPLERKSCGEVLAMPLFNATPQEALNNQVTTPMVMQVKPIAVGSDVMVMPAYSHQTPPHHSTKPKAPEKAGCFSCFSQPQVVQNEPNPREAQKAVLPEQPVMKVQEQPVQPTQLKELQGGYQSPLSPPVGKPQAQMAALPEQPAMKVVEGQPVVQPTQPKEMQGGHPNPLSPPVGPIYSSAGAPSGYAAQQQPFLGSTSPSQSKSLGNGVHISGNFVHLGRNDEMIEMNLVLNMVFEITGQAGSRQRNCFEIDLRLDLSAATGMGTKDFNILNVSKIGNGTLVDLSAPEKAAQEISKQSFDPSSKIFSGRVTRFLNMVSLGM